MNNIMIPIITSIIAILAAIGAALVAGFFSYINLINAKESKISEFRQNWIDSLRQEIALFHTSIVQIIQELDINLDNSDNKSAEEKRKDFFEKTKDDYAAALTSYYSIKMRINDKSTASFEPMAEDAVSEINSEAKFLMHLEKIYGSFMSIKGDRPSFDTVFQTVIVPEFEKFELEANVLLKHHWKRVKCGEEGFVKAKSMANRVLKYGSPSLIFVVVVVIFTIYKYSSPSVPNKYVCYFENNKYELTNGTIKEIEKIIQSNTVENRVIALSGYADATGLSPYNETLAQKRVLSIKNMLIQSGIPENKILVNSFGSRNLPIKTAGNVKEPRNRVVEISINPK